MAIKKPAYEMKKKREPFKTRKTTTHTPQQTVDIVTPPGDIARAIDRFTEAGEQAQHFLGEATIHKDTILNFAENEYVKRLLSGNNGSFKILGDESQVTFIVTDSSSGLTDDDVTLIAVKWGKKAAEDLIVRDFKSIRFDDKILANHYTEVVTALQTLPDNLLENLFKPMLMKTKPGAADTAKEYAKTHDELRELLRALKIKNYIK